MVKRKSLVGSRSHPLGPLGKWKVTWLQTTGPGFDSRTDLDSEWPSQRAPGCDGGNGLVQWLARRALNPETSVRLRHRFHIRPLALEAH